MLNIVVPMAGHGSRFANAGYLDPKPLILVCGQPMIKLVIDNLRPQREHRFIFLCQQQHLIEYSLGEKLNQWAPGCQIISVDQVTEGAACTVLMAKNFINNTDPLMIANCDQYVSFPIEDYLSKMDTGGVDGLIMTMFANDPKWSFVKLHKDGRVSEVVEKIVVSNEATVGIYNFENGDIFVTAAESMILNNIRVNNEFYVAPVYNELIAKGCCINIYNIETGGGKMFGLGTPEDLDYFISLNYFK